MSQRGDFAPESWSPTADYYIADGHDIRDAIEAFELNYNRGAVVKYMARAGRKPGNGALLDCLKAKEHIDREIACLSQNLEPAARQAIKDKPPAADLVIPVRALRLAMEAYDLSSASARRGERPMRHAEQALISFFDHYGVKLDFSGNDPARVAEKRKRT